MSKKNEDSIERFFRKAVTQNDTLFRESDWHNMEKMLDERDAKAAAIRASNFRRAMYSLLVLAIIPAAVYWLMPGQETSTTSQLRHAQVTAEKSETGAEKTNVAQQPSIPAQQADANTATTTVKDNSGGSIDASRRVAQSKPAATTALPADSHEVNKPSTNTTSSAAGKVTARLSLPSKKKNGASHSETVQEDTAVKSQPRRYDSPQNSGRSIPPRSLAKIETPGSKQQAGISAPTTSMSVKTPVQTSSPGQFSETTDAIIPARKNTKQESSGIRNEGKQAHTTTLPEPLLLTENRKVKPSNEKQDNTSSRTEPVFDNTALEVARQQQEAPTLQVLSNANSGEEKQREAYYTAPVEGNNSQHNAGETNQPLQTENQGVKQTGEHATSTGRQVDRNNNQPSLLTVNHEKAPVDKQQQMLSADSVATHMLKEEEVLPEKKAKPSRWNVALMVAPDFTSTALERYTAPGNAYGLTVGYRFYGRLVVSTGLIRTSKKYVGYGSDYQPPEGYWLKRTKGVVPDEIAGQCKILEIPLMVQYRFRQRQLSYFHAAAGISSYILVSEAYQYSFESPPPDAAQGWSSSESSTYPFAVGHVSIAYERKVLPWLGVGVEPFLKIPFGGIGWPNVNLYSTGLFVNVRYSF